MSTIVPPREVFAVEPKPVSTRIGESGYDIAGFTKVGRNRDGEMLSFFEGFPVPRKGIVYNEAVKANNEVKRLTLSIIAPFACKEMILPGLGFLILPFKWKIGFLERYLENYTRLADSLYLNCERVPYLKKEYYNNCSKECWDLAKNFLVNLGISERIAWSVGRIIATLLEYDDYYRIRVEDPMSEFHKEELIKYPSKFISKFIKILSERDKNGEYSVNKLAGFGRLLGLVLYHPKIKKAFIEAVKVSNFKWLQLDEFEVFWNLHRSDYDLLGKDIGIRYACFLENIENHKLKQNGLSI